MRLKAPALGIALVSLSLAACEGKQATDAKAAAQPAGDAKGPAFDDKSAGAEAGPGATPEPTNPETDAAPDLGQRFRDPAWFRKELFADATNVELHRTKADEKGMFSSNLRFFLPAGQTPEGCAKFLQEKVGAEVKNLESKQLEDGRFELKGSTERYTVTMQCGAPKGELIAFVAYQWTS